MTKRMMVPINETYHKKLKQLAEASHRSMTAQVEWLVEQAYWKQFTNHSQPVKVEYQEAE